MGDEHEVNTKIEEDYLYLQIIPLNKTDDYVVHTPDKDNNLNYWSYDTLHLAILDGDFKLSLDKFSRKQMDELFL